jgi:hypothetical protein
MRKGLLLKMAMHLVIVLVMKSEINVLYGRDHLLADYETRLPGTPLK